MPIEATFPNEGISRPFVHPLQNPRFRKGRADYTHLAPECPAGTVASLEAALELGKSLMSALIAHEYVSSPPSRPSSFKLNPGWSLHFTKCSLFAPCVTPSFPTGSYGTLVRSTVCCSPGNQLTRKSKVVHYDLNVVSANFHSLIPLSLFPDISPFREGHEPCERRLETVCPARWHRFAVN